MISKRFRIELMVKPHESDLRIHLPQGNLNKILILEGKRGIGFSSFVSTYNNSKDLPEKT